MGTSTTSNSFITRPYRRRKNESKFSSNNNYNRNRNQQLINLNTQALEISLFPMRLFSAVGPSPHQSFCVTGALRLQIEKRAQLLFNEVCRDFHFLWVVSIWLRGFFGAFRRGWQGQNLVWLLFYGRLVFTDASELLPGSLFDHAFAVKMHLVNVYLLLVGFKRCKASLILCGLDPFGSIFFLDFASKYSLPCDFSHLLEALTSQTSIARGHRCLP